MIALLEYVVSLLCAIKLATLLNASDITIEIAQGFYKISKTVFQEKGVQKIFNKALRKLAKEYKHDEEALEILKIFQRKDELKKIFGEMDFEKGIYYLKNYPLVYHRILDRISGVFYESLIEYGIKNEKGFRRIVLETMKNIQINKLSKIEDSLNRIEKEVETRDYQEIDIPEALIGEKEKITMNELRKFYTGGPVNWRLLAVDADIKREQQDAIEKILLQKLAQENGFSILCVVGEAGSGKTTFLRRVVYELCKKGEMVVEPRNSGFWSKISQYFENEWSENVYVYCDSLYEDDIREIKRNIIQGSYEFLPHSLILITAARPYYFNRFYKKREFKGIIKKFELNPLSEQEKEEALKKFGEILGKPDLSIDDLYIEEKERYEKATSFLILGLEVIGGKEFKEVIEDEISQIEKDAPLLSEAYKYICFSSMHNTSVPEELLENINPSFYNISKNKYAEGLIYKDPLRPDFLQARHQIIARESFLKYMEIGTNPKEIINNIVLAINPINEKQRYYIISLLQNILRSNALGKEKWKVKNYIKSLIAGNEFSKIINRATIKELYLLRTIFRYFRLHAKYEFISKKIEVTTPTDSNECQLLVNELLNKRKIKETFKLLKEWLEKNPNDISIYQRYLWFVKSYKIDEKELKKIFDEVIKWLEKHPEDTQIRANYLSLVRVKGEYIDIKKAIEEMENWRKGRIMDQTLFLTYLSLLEKGKKLGIRIKNVEELKQYGINSILQPFLENPKGRMVNFVEDFVYWLRDIGFYEEAENAYQKLIKVIPKSYQLHYGYGLLLVDTGRYKEAEKEFRKVIKIHRGHQMANLYMGIVLKEQNRIEEAEKWFKSALNWAEIKYEEKQINKRELGRFYHDIGLFYLEIKKYHKALKYLQKAASLFPKNFANWWRLACVCEKLKRWGECVKYAKKALWRAPPNLQPPAGEEIPMLLERCKQQLK